MFCLLAYLFFFTTTLLLFGGPLRLNESLLALFGAPLLFQLWPRIGLIFFASTHSLWTGLLVISVMQFCLLEPDFRMGDLTLPRILINSFSSVLNLLVLVWLTMYNNLNKSEDAPARTE